MTIARRTVLGIAFTAGMAAGAGAAPTYTTFDAPGSTLTQVTGIDSEGDTVGVGLDNSFSSAIGFLRSKTGKFTLYGEPDTGPRPMAINKHRLSAGAVNGKGFIGARDGTWTEFTVPGATQGVNSAVIDGHDNVAGDFADEASPGHGFFRSATGAIVVFDADDVGGSQGEGTFVRGIGARGAVFGIAQWNSRLHGFSRTHSGEIVTIDLPEAGTLSSQGTAINCVNRRDVIAGFYIDVHYVQHAFLRKPGRATQTIDIADGLNPTVSAINTRGDVTGWYQDNETRSYHGFLRKEESGQIETFDVEDENVSGTFPQAISDHGVIAGRYEMGGLYRAFIRKP